MTKQQKIDKLLEVVGQLIELTTFDDFIATAEQRSQHYMSDATYEVLEELHKAYRDIDFFEYEKRMGEGISKAAETRSTKSTKELTNETD